MFGRRSSHLSRRDACALLKRPCGGRPVSRLRGGGDGGHGGVFLTAEPRQASRQEAIHLPRNSAIGVAIAFFSAIGGFALVWHIWWLAIICFVGLVVAALINGWTVDREVEIPAAEIIAFERARLQEQRP